MKLSLCKQAGESVHLEFVQSPNQTNHFLHIHSVGCQLIMSLTQPRVFLHHSVFFMGSSPPSFTQKPGLSGSIMTGCFKQNSKWWHQKPQTSQWKFSIMCGVIHRSTCSESADVKAKTVAVFFFSKKITRSRHKHHIFFFLLSKNIQHAQNFLQCAASKISSLIIVWLWFFLVRPLPPTSCFPTSWERLSSSTSTHTPQPISHSSPDRFVIFLFIQVLEINRVASQQQLNWKNWFDWVHSAAQTSSPIASSASSGRDFQRWGPKLSRKTRLKVHGATILIIALIRACFYQHTGITEMRSLPNVNTWPIFSSCLLVN